MLQFDEQQKSFSFRTSSLTIKDWHITIQVNDSLLGLKDARIESGPADTWEIFFDKPQMQLSIKTFWDAPKLRLFVNATLHNHSDKPLRLGKVRLFESDNFSQFSAKTVCLPLAGNLGARKVWQITDPEAPLTSKIKTVFFDSTTEQALLAGFVSFHQIDTNVTHTISTQGLDTLSLDCDFHDWEMPAKSDADLETMYLAVSQNPYTLLENWADQAAGNCHPRKWEDAPIGWLGWAWVDALSVENYQETLIRNCQAIREKLGGFDIRYVWISMGNLVSGSPGEWDQWNYKNFPDGPEYLSSKLQQIGFKFGLWCAPFWLCGNQKKLMTHFSDALLQNPDGTPFIAVDHWRYVLSTELTLEERPPIYQLDPTHPKVHEFMRDVFSNARKWGVRYYMIDFLKNSCGPIDPDSPITGYSNSQLRPGPETYFSGLDVIREAVGDDTYLLTSSGPNIHNAGFADGIRTGNDFGEGRAIAPETFFYPATFVINSGQYWTGPGRALQNQASSYYTHRKLFINDSGNVLTVDKPLPLEAARIHATIHGLSGGPSMMGDDIGRISEERLALIQKTLPRTREVAVPLDLFASPAPSMPHLFHRHIKKNWGSFDVLAVYNFTENMLTETVPLSQLNLSNSAEYLVWEFWNDAYIGTTTGELKLSIPPGCVRIFRITANVDHPQVVGSDMHLLMGEMEIVNCKWDAKTLSLSGSAYRPTTGSGNLFFRVPEGMAVKNPKGFWIAKDARDSSLIIRAAFNFQGEPIPWSISFINY